MEAVERVAGKYRAKAVRMDDLVRRHATVVQYRERKLGAGIPDNHFAERHLKRGR